MIAYFIQKKLFTGYKQIRGLVKRNKTIFSLHRHLTDEDYKRQLCCMKQCRSKPKSQIENEMKRYAEYWKCPADDYVRYGLFEKSLPIEDILDYVPMQYYYCNYYDEQFSGIDIAHWEDKWNEHILLKEKGINTPKVVALVQNGRLCSVGKRITDMKSLLANTLEGERLFIKPTNGNSGNGIFVLNKINGIFKHKEKIITSINDLKIKKHLNYIVQRGLIQRNDLAEINESSLNTLRTIVKYTDGKPHIVAILLRMGRKGCELDNSGQGGISVSIDLSTGLFGDFAGREHGGGIFYEHPDTGYVFKGKGIRDWNDIFGKIQKTVSCINTFKLIGWDLAIGEDSQVYVIEFNMGFGIEHAQTILGGFRRRLEICPKHKGTYK